MDFQQLFNDVSNNSDMDLSGSGVSGLMSSTDSSPTDPIMLSLDEQLLSSFAENRSLPLPSSASSSSECFYFIPDLSSSTCTLVNTLKDGGVNVTCGGEDKLFIKSEDSGIWMLAEEDKRDENMDASPSSIRTTASSLATPTKTKFMDGNNAQRELPYTRSENKFHDSYSPADSLQHSQQSEGSPVSRKRKAALAPNRNLTNGDKSLREGLQLSKASARSKGIKKAVTKVANGKVRTVGEKFLETLAESLTEKISNTVRQEVKHALDGLKTFLDERLSQLVRTPAALTQCQPGPSEEGSPQDSDKESHKQTSMEGTSNAMLCSNMQNVESAEYKLQLKESTVNFNHDVPKPSLTQSGSGQRIFKSEFLLESETQPIDAQPGSEIFEKRRISTVNTLLKYVTSPSLIETLKKSIENCNVDENLNPGDALNMSISSCESTASESNDMFVYPKFSLGMVQEEKFPGKEEESLEPSESASYLEILSTKSTHFLEETEIKDGMKQEKIISVSNESCTAIVPFVSASTDVKRPTTRPKPEKVPKPELALRKYKKPLICTICDRSFLNNSSLKQHMAFHQPQRPYQCDEVGCDKSYKTRSELNRHIIVHSGEKNYACLKCGKSFLRKQYLKTHLIRHNDGLTWQCSLCAKIFVSEEDLKKHKVSYHKNGKRSSVLMVDKAKKLALTYHLDDSLEA